MAHTIASTQAHNHTQILNYIKIRARMANHSARVNAYQGNFRENLRKQVQTSYTPTYDETAYLTPKAAVSVHGTTKRVFILDMEHRRNATVNVSIVASVTPDGGSASDITLTATGVDATLSRSNLLAAIVSGLSSNAALSVATALNSHALAVTATSGNTLGDVTVTITDGSTATASVLIQIPTDLSSAPLGGF